MSFVKEQITYPRSDPPEIVLWILHLSLPKPSYVDRFNEDLQVQRPRIFFPVRLESGLAAALKLLRHPCVTPSKDRRRVYRVRHEDFTSLGRTFQTTLAKFQKHQALEQSQIDQRPRTYSAQELVVQSIQFPALPKS
jgi:hypothetical protein